MFFSAMWSWDVSIFQLSLINLLNMILLACELFDKNKFLKLY